MASQDNTTRKGKIARLPRTIREALNQKLYDGKPAKEILPWLNADVEVQAILKESFDGEPINEQNLTNWRQGGYQDWCSHQEEADRLRTYAELSTTLVQATGLSLSDGAAAIAAGNILARLEGEAGVPKEEVISMLVSLRSGDHAVADGKRKDRKLDLDTKKAQMKERELALAEEKFRRTLIEKLIETAQKPEVQRILTGGQPKAVQMDLLHEQLFGKPPEDRGEAA